MPHREPQDDAKRCREWNGDEQTDESEQPSECEQGEHQPDGIEFDA
jgi:hypothetical protein